MGQTNSLEDGRKEKKKIVRAPFHGSEESTKVKFKISFI